jgi:hypothetical protein
MLPTGCVDNPRLDGSSGPRTSPTWGCPQSTSTRPRTVPTTSWRWRACSGMNVVIYHAAWDPRRAEGPMTPAPPSGSIALDRHQAAELFGLEPTALRARSPPGRSRPRSTRRPTFASMAPSPRLGPRRDRRGAVGCSGGLHRPRHGGRPSRTKAAGNLGVHVFLTPCTVLFTACLRRLGATFVAWLTSWQCSAWPCSSPSCSGSSGVWNGYDRRSGHLVGDLDHRLYLPRHRNV